MRVNHWLLSRFAKWSANDDDENALIARQTVATRICTVVVRCVNYLNGYMPLSYMYLESQCGATTNRRAFTARAYGHTRHKGRTVCTLYDSRPRLLRLNSK